MVEKTPEWAAPICGISADRIKELAAEIGAAKPLYVVRAGARSAAATAS